MSRISTIIRPRILLVGNFKPQDFEFCWWKWLQEHQYPVFTLDTAIILKKYFRSYILIRLFLRFFRSPVVFFVSRQFMSFVNSFNPNLVLVVSGNLISAHALQTVRNETNATLYHFYGEDFFNSLNTTSTLREAAYFYDHFFTTKTFNIPELAAIGLHHVSYLPFGYRPNCDNPITIDQTDRMEFGSDLAFIGTWEEERATNLAQLTEFNLRIWGASWHRADKKLGLGKAIQNRAVYCDEMSRVINASKINLAFLRKANRDRHTSRTFEIPACGGFQLSERTDEVLSFYNEGKEIECFESIDELKEKARYYLSHEAERQRIASAGLVRTKHSAYSYTDRLNTILEHYSKMKSL
jgi:spore maturation protein CgeB